TAAMKDENARLASASADAAALTKELADTKAKLAAADKSATDRQGSLAELGSINEKPTTEKNALEKQLDSLTEQLTAAQAENTRLGQADQRAASLDTVSAQLTTAQRDVANLKSENARLNETVTALDRDRTTKISQLQQE